MSKIEEKYVGVEFQPIINETLPEGLITYDNVPKNLQKVIQTAMLTALELDWNLKFTLNKIFSANQQEVSKSESKAQTIEDIKKELGEPLEDNYWEQPKLSKETWENQSKRLLNKAHNLKITISSPNKLSLQEFFALKSQLDFYNKKLLKVFRKNRELIHQTSINNEINLTTIDGFMHVLFPKSKKEEFTKAYDNYEEHHKSTYRKPIFKSKRTFIN